MKRPTSKATRQKLREAARRRFRAVVIPRREAHRLLKKQLVELRKQAMELRKQERRTLAAVRTVCARSRARAQARAKKRRAELLQQAKAETQALLKAARSACTRRLTQAERATMSQIAQLRDEAERRKNRYLADWGKRGAKVALQRESKAIERRVRAEQSSESDAAVERNLAPELVPLWRKMRKQFATTPKLSRTEAFEQWVESNPEEVQAMLATHGEEGWRRELKEVERIGRKVNAAIQRQGSITVGELDELGISVRDLERAGLGAYLA